MIKKICYGILCLSVFLIPTQALDINVYKYFNDTFKPLGLEMMHHNIVLAYGTNKESGIEISEIKVGYRQNTVIYETPGFFWGLGYVSYLTKMSSMNLETVNSGIYFESGYSYHINDSVYSSLRLIYDTAMEEVNYGVSIAYKL